MSKRFGQLSPVQWVEFFNKNGIETTQEIIEETAGFLIAALGKTLENSGLEGTVVIGETDDFRFMVTPTKKQSEEAKWH